jgi:hypothetical protein
VGNIVSGGIDYQQAEDLSIENITLDNNFVPEKKK